jgi:hypothetical protein
MPIRLPRWVKIALAGAAGIVAVSVLGVVVLVHTIDLAKYAKLATDEVKTPPQWGTPARSAAAAPTSP